MAWSRGARLAAVSALSYGAVNAVAVSAEATGRTSLAVLVAVAIVSFAVLWPLLALGLYCAWRWVGVEPLPWLWDPLGRGRPARFALVAAASIVAMFVLSYVSLALFPPVTQMTGPVMEYTKLPTFARVVIAGTGVWEENVFRLALLFPLAAAFGVRASSRRAFPVGLALAILATSFLFALAHLGNITDGGTTYFLFTMLHKGLFVGGLLGVVAWRWGVEVAIVAHVGFDAIALVIAG